MINDKFTSDALGRTSRASLRGNRQIDGFCGFKISQNNSDFHNMLSDGIENGLKWNFYCWGLSINFAVESNKHFLI